MTDRPGRLFLLLASSDASDSELREFARWVERRGSRSLVRHVGQLRRLAVDDEAEPEAAVAFTIPNEGEKVGERLLSREDNPAERIDHLLRAEAGLPAQRASEMLLEAVRPYAGVAQTELPQLGKRSFTDWVSRLANYIPYSILLHAAVSIRNSNSIERSVPWPLRNK